MPKHFRLSGNSLVITIVISLVLAIICSSVILLAYYNRKYQLKDESEQRVRRNLESAINLVIADTAIYTQEITERIDLFGEQKDSVEIKKALWGIFELATVRSFQHLISDSQSFFYGASMPGYMKACLYVADHKRRIAVVGNTKLTGDGYLPEAGIEPSYINQRGYNGNKLIDGSVKNSADSLPVLKEIVIDDLKNLFHQRLNEHTGDIDDSIAKSFADTTLQIYKKEKVILKNLILNGRILIKSDKEIEIDSTAHLKNIIVIAPVIRFKNGSGGNIQAIAFDSLIIEENCSFEYPSALVLIKNNNLNLQNRLIIGDKCFINGIVLSVCRNNDPYKTYVEIGNQTKISGIVYSMGYTSLKGNVDGIVMTDFFIYKSPSTIYENYLVDVSINRRQLSGHFLIPSVFNSSEKGIIQWVK